MRTRLPDHEAVVLEGLNDSIQNSKARVTSRIEILSARRQQDIHKTTSATGIEVHATHSEVRKVSQSVMRLEGETSNINRGIREVIDQGTCLDGKVGVLDEHVISMNRNMIKTYKEMKEEHQQEFMRLRDLLSTMLSNKNEVLAMIKTEFYQLTSEMPYRASKSSPQV